MWTRPAIVNLCAKIFNATHHANRLPIIAAWRTVQFGRRADSIYTLAALA